MDKKKVNRFFSSTSFKKITLVLGVIFFIVSLFSFIKPEPFLKLGYLGIFVFNLFGAGTFLVPALALKMNIVLLAFVTAAGMAINDSVAWVVGRSSEAFIPHGTKINRIEKSINRFGVYALFVWSLIPFPYDLVGLVAGYLGITYPRYVIPTFMGKFVRFLMMGYGILVFSS